MPPAFVTLDPSSMAPARVYELLVNVVQPRPIAFVSTLGPEGVPNLAPFSFFNVGGISPPSLVFSVTANARGGPKDTLRNVLETGEFVVNTVHRAMAEAMNETSYAYERGVSEWEAAGLTPIASEAVRPPRVAESLVHLECRLFRHLAHGEGPGAANYVVGEIVRIHVAEGAWTGSGADPARLRLLARLGGPNYLDSDALALFEMARPIEPKLEL